MTNPGQETPSFEMGYYTRVLRRRWYVAALGLVVGLALAAAYLSSAQRSVTATSTVRLNLITAEPFSTAKSPSELIDAQTEVQTATSSKVMIAAARDIASDRSAQQMRQNTTAALIANTAVMRISYTGSTQADAERGADAVASEYLKYRGELADDQITSSVDKLTSRRDQLRNDLIAANTQQANARDGSTAAIQAESDAQLIGIELNSVNNELNAFQGIDTTGGVSYIAAGQAGASVSPSRQLIFGVLGGLGLVVGMLLAFLVDRLDRRLRDRHDVRHAGGGEVLSQLGGTSATLPAAGRDLDEIRSLRERLLASLPEDSPMLAVSDLTRGPSDVGPNLAYAMSETGRLVDLVMPGVSPEFLAEVVDGFALADKGEINGVHWYSGGNLDLLVPPTDSLLVSGDAFLADRLSARAPQTDVTVVVLPPQADRSQRLAAARLGHSLILVVSPRATSAHQVARLADEVAAVGAVVHGSVLVHRGRSLAHRDTVSTPSTPSSGARGSEAAVGSTTTPVSHDQPAARS